MLLLSIILIFVMVTGFIITVVKDYKKPENKHESFGKWVFLLLIVLVLPFYVVVTILSFNLEKEMVIVIEKELSNIGTKDNKLYLKLIEQRESGLLKGYSKYGYVNDLNKEYHTVTSYEDPEQVTWTEDILLEIKEKDMNHGRLILYKEVFKDKKFNKLIDYVYGDLVFNELIRHTKYEFQIPKGTLEYAY